MQGLQGAQCNKNRYRLATTLQSVTASMETHLLSKRELWQHCLSNIQYTRLTMSYTLVTGQDWTKSNNEKTEGNIFTSLSLVT